MADDKKLQKCAEDAQDMLQAAKVNLTELYDCLVEMHAFVQGETEKSRCVLAGRTSVRTMQLSLDIGHEELADLLEKIDAELAAGMTRRR